MQMAKKTSTLLSIIMASKKQLLELMMQKIKRNFSSYDLPLTVTLMVLAMAARIPFWAVQVYDPCADLSTELIKRVPLGN